MKKKELMKVMLKILGPLLVLSPTRCDDDVLELFRTSCPYNNFCTMDSLKDVSQLNDTRYTPCCLDCFCDEACHAYRDCCPDVHSFEPQHGLTNDANKYGQCISTIIPIESEYMDQNWQYISDHYRMFNTCPSNYTDTGGIVDKCEEDVYSRDRSYEDVVIVSGPNNVMYRNIYCAMCRGVTDVTRWQLKVITCQEHLASVRLEASKMKTYIMENCTLVSVRPDTLRLNSRLLQCWEEDVVKCNGNANGTTNDALIAGCENGTYMPYSDDYGTIYKNALCYQCNSFTEITHSLCLDTLDVLTRSNIGSLTNLIDTTDGISEASPKDPCEESQILDYYADECRTLYCPPYHAAVYGKCQRIATPARLSVIVRTVFWTTENITITQPIRLYNNSIRNMYARKQRERFSKLNCPGIAVFVDIQKAPDTNKLLYVIVDSHIEIGGRKCTIAGIGNVIRNQPSITGTWIINDEIVKMQGQYSFVRTPEDENLSIRKDYVLYERNSQVSFLFMDEFIVCPYVEIGLDWYNKLMSMVAGSGNVTKLSSLSMKTKTLVGTYALSESKLAMCVDQHMLYMFRPKSKAVFLLPSVSKVVILSWFHILAHLF